MTTDQSDKLTIGDKVSRSWQGVTREGMIVEVYASMPSGIGTSHHMYGVQWDDTGLVERGYLRTGLQKCFLLPPILLPGVK